MQKHKLHWERGTEYARGSVNGLIKFRISYAYDNGFEEWTVAASRPLETPMHLEMSFTNCDDAILWCELLWEKC